MHGAGLWGASQRDISGWNELADAKGFIVVYPSGVGGKGVRVWRAEPGDDLAKDVRFISELIDTLKASYNIDSTRIYANGLSNGGGMSFALSCALSNRIAAVGMVAAAQTPVALVHRRTTSSDDCVSRDCGSESHTTAARRGYHPDPFRARRNGRRIGREETGARPILSNQTWRRM
jgi:poly(3-hydroxybutyrate) depolymerase